MRLLDYFMWSGKEGVSKNGEEKLEGGVTRSEFRLRLGNFWKFIFFFFPLQLRTALEDKSTDKREIGPNLNPGLNILKPLGIQI